MSASLPFAWPPPDTVLWSVQAPKVKFSTKINMSSVSGDGAVGPLADTGCQAIVQVMPLCRSRAAASRNPLQCAFTWEFCLTFVSSGIAGGSQAFQCLGTLAAQVHVGDCPRGIATGNGHPAQSTTSPAGRRHHVLVTTCCRSDSSVSQIPPCDTG